MARCKNALEERSNKICEINTNEVFGRREIAVLSTSDCAKTNPLNQRLATKDILIYTHIARALWRPAPIITVLLLLCLFNVGCNSWVIRCR